MIWWRRRRRRQSDSGYDCYYSVAVKPMKNESCITHGILEKNLFGPFDQKRVLFCKEKSNLTHIATSFTEWNSYFRFCIYNNDDLFDAWLFLSVTLSLCRAPHLRLTQSLTFVRLSLPVWHSSTRTQSIASNSDSRSMLKHTLLGEMNKMILCAILNWQQQLWNSYVRSDKRKQNDTVGWRLPTNPCCSFALRNYNLIHTARNVESTFII